MSHHRGRAEIRVTATPAEAYAVVADVTRTPEWSPEVYRCRWMSEAGAEVSARFRGWSHFRIFRWWRDCEVVAADPPREFAFRTLTRWFVHDQTEWRYRFEPEGDGTRIVESYEVLRPADLHILVADRLIARARDRTPDMASTLERLREALERRV